MTPGVDPVRVSIDLLPHAPACCATHRPRRFSKAAQAHARSRRGGVVKQRPFAPSQKRLIVLLAHRIDDDLQTAVLGLACDLFLDRVTRTQWHGDELAYDVLGHTEAVAFEFASVRAVLKDWSIL